MSLRQAAKDFKVSVPKLINWRKEETLMRGNLINDILPPLPQSGRERPTTEPEMLREEVERLKHERDRLRLGVTILVGIKVSQ